MSPYEDHPGSGSHAADTDDLVRDVHHAVLLDEVPAVRLQRADVVAEQPLHPRVEVQAELREVQLTGRDDNRRVVDDPEATIDPLVRYRCAARLSRAYARPTLLRIDSRLVFDRSASSPGSSGQWPGGRATPPCWADRRARGS